MSLKNNDNKRRNLRYKYDLSTKVSMRLVRAFYLWDETNTYSEPTDYEILCLFDMASKKPEILRNVLCFLAFPMILVSKSNVKPEWWRRNWLVSLHCVRSSLSHYASNEMGQISNQTDSIKPNSGRKSVSIKNKVQVLNVSKSTKFFLENFLKENFLKENYRIQRHQSQI